MNSNTFTVNTGNANGGNGGVLHLENSGFYTFTWATVTFNTVKAFNNGGIASFNGGTDLSLIVTDFTVNTCVA